MDMIILLYTALITICVTFIIRWFIIEDRISKHVNKIPGDIRLPFFGTVFAEILIPREDVFRKAKYNIGRFGKIARSWFGNLPLIEIMSAECAEPILRSSEHITKGFVYNFIIPWLGDGLLLSTGAKWFRQRKLITPTFHFKILDTFMEVFVEKSKLLADQLRSKANGKVFDIYPYVTHCALDIICETAMGVEMNAMSNKDNDYVKAIYGISEIIVHRSLRPWLYPAFIFNNTSRGKLFNKYLANLHNFTHNVIKDRKGALSAAPQTTASPVNEVLGKKKRMAFLDLLIQGSGNTLCDREIREEVDTFMFEGHDTTAAAICWTLFLLGNHPEIQEQVHAEIANLFQGNDKNLTINDLSELKLLERCIKEALRLYPSVPVIARKITEDVQIGKTVGVSYEGYLFTFAHSPKIKQVPLCKTKGLTFVLTQNNLTYILGEYLIPSGCTAVIHLYLIHMDETNFPEPNRFNPDRFLPENVKNRHPYAYIPFSAGPRNCIGQKFAMHEEKTVLAYILRKFKVKAIENQETIVPVMDLILRPIDGLNVTLELRV